MANNDPSRLEDLERRLAALEGTQGASPAGASDTGTGAQPTSAEDAAAVQAFFTGALVASAIQQGATTGTQGQGEGAAPLFMSIVGCGGGGGWNPTKYDSFFWCRSRFACNPQSLSCLC